MFNFMLLSLQMLKPGYAENNCTYHQIFLNECWSARPEYVVHPWNWSVFIFSSGHFLQILLKEEGADISERYHVTVLGEIMLIKLKTIQLKKKSVSPDPRIVYLHSIFSSLPRQIYSSIVTTTTHSALPYDSNIFLSSLYFVFRCIILRKINRQS